MRSLADLLFAVDGAPDDPCVHWRARTWSRREISAAAQRLADTLARMGTAPDSAVAALVPSTPLGIVTCFGIWRAGAVAAAIDASVAPEELDRLVAEVRPAVVVRPSLDEASLVPQVTVSPGEPRHYDVGVATIESTVRAGRPPSRVLCTHDAQLASIAAAEGTLRGASVGVVSVPLGSWIGADNALVAIGRGGAAVLLDPFSPTAFADAVRRFGVESATLTRAMVASIADEPAVTTLEPLRSVRTVTAPPSPEEVRDFRSRFGVTVLGGYGRPELGAEVVGWSNGDARLHGDGKLGAVGRPYPGVDVRVRRDDGTEAEPDHSGEIWVRSPFGARGSLSDRVEPSTRLDDEGFLRTGDRGRLDRDGFLWIDEPPPERPDAPVG